MNAAEITALKGKRKIVVLTAYDYQIARVLEEAEVDMILVGDSSGMVVQGYPNTKSVTLEDMLFHTRAVARGARKTLVVADMPIHTYDTAPLGLTNAQRFLEAGANAVKIEGNRPEVISALLKRNIPVMGHLGLLPQTAEKTEVQGKTPEQADRLWRDALELDKLGVFSLVLECIPEWLGRKISSDVKTPTIGIGAGKFCDGQVLVINDMLGFTDGPTPKFVKAYANLRSVTLEAVRHFADEVKSGAFPDKNHTYH
jgi:3-methyl-2-oxobutanoate hydroxymethyltransferase